MKGEGGTPRLNAESPPLPSSTFELRLKAAAARRARAWWVGGPLRPPLLRDLRVSGFPAEGGRYRFRWLATRIISRIVFAMVMALTPVGS